MEDSDNTYFRDNEKSGIEYYFMIVLVATVLLLLIMPLTIKLIRIKTSYQSDMLLRDQEMNIHRANLRDNSTMYLCNSVFCFSQSQAIHDLLTFEKDPCRDFYDFSCQAKPQPLKAEARTALWENMLTFLEGIKESKVSFHTKLYSYFMSCKTAAATQESEYSDAVQYILKELGLREWPVKSVAGLPRISYVAGKLGQLLYTFPLVTLSMEVKDNQRYIKLAEPRMLRDVFEMDKYHFKEENFIAYLKRTMPTDNSEVPNRRAWNKAVRLALEFEGKITQAKDNATLFGNCSSTAVRSIKDMPESEVWDWEEFLRVILKDIFDDFLSPSTHIFYSKAYVEHLMKVFRHAELEQAMNMLGYWGIFNFLPMTVADNLDEPFVQDILIIRYGGKLENLCAETTFNIFKFYFTWMLLRSTFQVTSDQLYKHTKSMYFRAILEFFRITSSPISKLISAKLQNTTVSTHPAANTCTDEASCAEYYKYIPNLSGRSKYKQFLLSKAMLANLDLKLLAKEPGWRDTTFDAEALYVYGSNTLYVPLSLARQEFIGDESFMYVGTYGKTIVEPIVSQYLRKAVELYKKEPGSEEPTQWEKSLSCIATLFQKGTHVNNGLLLKSTIGVFLMSILQIAYDVPLSRIPSSGSGDKTKVLHLTSSFYIKKDKLFFVLYSMSFCNNRETAESLRMPGGSKTWLHTLLEQSKKFLTAFRCKPKKNTPFCLSTLVY
ncbi:uncharacterized protein LOC135400846 isoform X2 [Ornithodoros turicata]|uniref:uncharacterized protein LOC135400846 isoform X2 n=1 Tax=Ornithodoros turicata TaxID=34597 RepID=UPI003139D58A